MNNQEHIELTNDILSKDVCHCGSEILQSEITEFRVNGGYCTIYVHDIFTPVRLSNDQLKDLTDTVKWNTIRSSLY